MKNSVLLSLFFAFLLFSCDKKQQDTPGLDTSFDTSSSGFVDDHNARNSLDWIGEYHGTLPCADCEGIHTTVTLNADGSFHIREEYLKNPKIVIENSGIFEWDDNGMEIELDGDNDFDRDFKVIEGGLIQLDLQGNVITGELANQYKLIKK